MPSEKQTVFEVLRDPGILIVCVERGGWESEVRIWADEDELGETCLKISLTGDVQQPGNPITTWTFRPTPEKELPEKPPKITMEQLGKALDRLQQVDTELLGRTLDQIHKPSKDSPATS